MDNDFVKLAEKIIDKEGKDLLLDPKKTKAFFMDYGGREFKKELNLLVKAIELGYSNKIKDSEDLNNTKMILSRELIEEQSINDKMANNIILLLMGLLRNKSYLKKIDKISEINNNTVVKNDDNNRNEDKEYYFKLNDILYIARYSNGYPEIIEEHNSQRPRSMKAIARQFLREYNIDVPMDANRMNAHAAIRMLMNVLEEERKNGRTF